MLDRMFVSSHVSPASTQKIISNLFPFLPSDDSHFHFILVTEMALLLGVVRDFCYCLLRLELKFWEKELSLKRNGSIPKVVAHTFVLLSCSKKRKYQSFLPKRKGGTRFSLSRCR